LADFLAGEGHSVVAIHVHRQQQAAAAIFAAIKADGRLKAVYIDDMQHVLDMAEPAPRPSG
jgi:hypothetical protein